MRPRWQTLVLAAGASLLAGRAVQAQVAAGIDPDCEKLLPVKLVEKASGRAPIKLIARDPSLAAGGDCNYAIGGKTMVLLVNLDRFAGPPDYQRYKGAAMYRTDQQPIPGLGEEAFSASNPMLGTSIPVVTARKGKTLVVMSTFLEFDPSTAEVKGAYLTRAQLIELVREMLAKP